jgi:hypothetical protein
MLLTLPLSCGGAEERGTFPFETDDKCQKNEGMMEFYICGNRSSPKV